MATNLFVGGLAYALTDEELKELFQSVGAVKSAKIIMDRETNRSKGFGFVEMENDADTQKAINELNGKEVAGRSIAVMEARPRN